MKKAITLILILSFNIVLGQDKEILVKAQKGDVDAQLQLAGIYYYGKGVDIDYKKAFYWSNKVAEQNNVAAFFNVGKMYLLGEGTQKNTEKGLYWLKKGAERGDYLAQLMLGDIYYDGLGGVKIDKKRGVFWFEIASEQFFEKGVSEIQLKLSFIYDTDKDVLDEDKAIYWLKKSAENGNAKAQFYLALMYFEIEDYKKGEFWLRKACNNGSEKAKKLYKTIQID